MLLCDFKLRNEVNVSTLELFSRIIDLEITEDGECADFKELETIIDINNITDENAIDTLVCNLLNAKDYLDNGGSKNLTLYMLPGNCILDDELCNMCINEKQGE